MNQHEWSAQYERAWDLIRQGLGPFGDHVDDARCFVGDRALLRLFERFDPAAVIIATGIEITDCVLGPEGRREVGARDDDGRKEEVEIAVAEAHRQLVAIEGDEHWRRLLPDDAKAIMIAEIVKHKAAHT
jgi:hypothetical protein